MNGGPRAGCTAPQLRRFIKSRPYVPMHELRRRFGINGADDEVSALPIDQASVYVGLPERECRLLGELVRGGEVGYELSLDPRTPIVVGVYPMRPVPRADRNIVRCLSAPLSCRVLDTKGPRFTLLEPVRSSWYWGAGDYRSGPTPVLVTTVARNLGRARAQEAIRVSFSRSTLEQPQRP